jgi:predicted ATPase
MSPVTSKTRTTARDCAKLASMWNEIVLHLEDRRRALAAEIRNYPTPIPRCDAQFNHLYEQQARLARELDRIRALAGKTRGDIIELIERFIASAPYTDDGDEREFRSRMKKLHSALT